MNRQPVQIVVAVATNGVIGADGDMPWHLPEDLKRFKALTMGGTLVMGRRTFEAIGRPLPGRRTIVVTRNPDWDSGFDHVDVVTSLIDALDRAQATGRPVHVIGGGEIYHQVLPHVDAIELTEIHATPQGDTTFPALGPEWTLVSREDHDGYAFVRYEHSPDREPQQRGE